MTFQELLTENGDHPDNEELLLELAEESEYWEKCHSFYEDNKETDIDDLTDKQAAWVTKICDGVTNYRIEGKP